MIMSEELLNEGRFQRLNRARQSELIAEHCAGVEQRIRGAHSRAEAETIGSDACRQFENECPSDLVRRGLVHRVRQMVQQHWGKEGTT